MRAVGMLLVLAGCGRLGFDGVGFDAGSDGPADADAIAPTGTFCGIPNGEWTLTPPVALDDANELFLAQYPGMDRSEFDPVFSEDGRTLYVSSDQSVAYVVWAVQRETIDDAFTMAAMMPADVNAAGNGMFGFQPLASLSRGIISAPFAGGVGSLDIWLGTFTGTWSWSLSSLSTMGSDIDARLTADGRTIYFVRGNSDPEREILIATRPDVDSDFGAPAVVTSLSSPVSDSAPMPIEDGIVFASWRPGGLGDEDLWYASGTGTTFETPVPLNALNSASFDGVPAVFARDDGCELVFVSNRDGVFNLYRAYVRRASS